MNLKGIEDLVTNYKKNGSELAAVNINVLEKMFTVVKEAEIYVRVPVRLSRRHKLNIALSDLKEALRG